MYSYEERVRAVKLYIKLDKRIAATLIKLGYPTKNALKTWYRENEQRQDVNAMQSFNDAEHAVEKAAQEMEHTKETALLY